MRHELVILIRSLANMIVIVIDYIALYVSFVKFRGWTKGLANTYF